MNRSRCASPNEGFVAEIVFAVQDGLLECLLAEIMPPPNLCRTDKLEADISVIPKLIEDQRAA